MFLPFMVSKYLSFENKRKETFVLGILELNRCWIYCAALAADNTLLIARKRSINYRNINNINNFRPFFTHRKHSVNFDFDSLTTSNILICTLNSASAESPSRFSHVIFTNIRRQVQILILLHPIPPPRSTNHTTRRSSSPCSLPPQQALFMNRVTACSTCNQVLLLPHFLKANRARGTLFRLYLWPR